MNISSEGHKTHEIRIESTKNLSQGLLDLFQVSKSWARNVKENVYILEQKYTRKENLPLMSISWRHTKAGDWGSNSTR